jgi:hypothetical protein
LAIKEAPVEKVGLTRAKVRSLPSHLSLADGIAIQGLQRVERHGDPAKFPGERKGRRVMRHR